MLSPPLDGQVARTINIRVSSAGAAKMGEKGEYVKKIFKNLP